jgi:site-specific recombinase XerD
METLGTITVTHAITAVAAIRSRPKVVQELLGHSKIGTTLDTYSR